MVWGERGDEILVPGIAIGRKLFQCLGHGHHIVKDQQVGYEMIVFDELALLVSNALCSQCASAESDPLDKLIEAFALVRRSLDEPPQLNIGKIFEQKICTYPRTPTLEKRNIVCSFASRLPAV